MKQNFYIPPIMQLNVTQFVRLMMAFSVMISLAFAPLLTQQAMASHHSAGNVIGAMSEHYAATATDGSCEKSSDGQLSKSIECCEMSCSSLFAFETSGASLFSTRIADFDSVDSNQLTARASFGLKRPPRA